MEDEITEEEFDREFALGTPVKVRVKKLGSILSIRMDSELLYRVDDYARSRGIGITTAARQLIEEGLKLEADQREGLADVLDRVAAKLRETETKPQPPARARKSTRPAKTKPEAGKP